VNIARTHRWCTWRWARGRPPRAWPSRRGAPGAVIGWLVRSGGKEGSHCVIELYACLLRRAREETGPRTHLGRPQRGRRRCRGEALAHGPQHACKVSCVRLGSWGEEGVSCLLAAGVAPSSVAPRRLLFVCSLCCADWITPPRSPSRTAPCRPRQPRSLQNKNRPGRAAERPAASILQAAAARSSGISGGRRAGANGLKYTATRRGGRGVFQQQVVAEVSQPPPTDAAAMQEPNRVGAVDPACCEGFGGGKSGDGVRWCRRGKKKKKVTN
jgi:hypothetical protein